MSRFYGPIRQLGYIVNDVEASAQYWAKVFGIGPFFQINNIVYKDVNFRGQLIDIDADVALAYSGDMQIELIKQNSSDATIYTEFLDEHGEGLQHIAVWPDDYDASLEQIKRLGGDLLMDGVAGGGIRFAYLGGLVHAGAVLEVVTPTAGALKYYKIIKDASETWDGSMPIRTLSSDKFGSKSPN